jgi:hypothetical protein
MGGGRIPGPLREEAAHQDPLDQRGFTDAIPLGGGAGAGGVVTLTGWPRSITWDEFAERGSAPEGADEAAQISSEAIQPDQVDIDRTNGRFHVKDYTINVQVEAARTWVVKAQKSNALLAHEQGHYDITGLTARDMAEQIGAARAASPKALGEQVKAIITRTQALGDKLTKLYDGNGPTGTDHGKNAGNQAKWEAHLAACASKGTRLTGGPS